MGLPPRCGQPLEAPPPSLSQLGETRGAHRQLCLPVGLLVPGELLPMLLSVRNRIPTRPGRIPACSGDGVGSPGASRRLAQGQAGSSGGRGAGVGNRAGCAGPAGIRLPGLGSSSAGRMVHGRAAGRAGPDGKTHACGRGRGHPQVPPACSLGAAVLLGVRWPCDQTQLFGGGPMPLKPAWNSKAWAQGGADSGMSAKDVAY